MSNKDLYKQAFSVLHASEDLHIPKQRKLVYKKIPKIVVAVICLVVILGGIGTYAASRFLSTKQIATEMNDLSVKKAFVGNNVTQLNEMQRSHGYDVTLLGIVTSDDSSIATLEGHEIEIIKDNTYIAFAVEKDDGSAIIEGQKKFNVVPLIQGTVLAEIMAPLLGGCDTYSFIEQGGLYEVVAMPNMEIFADRGVWLGITDADEVQKVFVLNPKDDRYRVTSEDNNMAVLFQLPLDATKADTKRAEERLEQYKEGQKAADALQVLEEEIGK